jgi:phenylalanyl-tRNA synthetase beta chain
MKLSLAWIFDHIDADWKTQDVDYLVAQFNNVTAEIEDFYRVAFDLHRFSLGSVTACTADHIELALPEAQASITLPVRSDITGPQMPGFFMVKKDGEAYAWATLADFGVEKDGLVPALDADAQSVASGAWRTQFEAEDVVIEVDNKSITHRPDMWGHRGFAREIAAYLNLPLHNKERFLIPLQTINFEHQSQHTSTTPVVIENHVPHACSRFAGLYFSSITNKPTPLLIASRLMKVGARPMNAVVDLANYLMNDWSQPVHTYDANAIAQNRVEIRMAHEGETIDLLDGNRLTLDPRDMVIADAQKPLCLAGVKGGIYSGITETTKAVFFESATFDAGTVRRTAQRHKLRTDASARFEKTLDVNQTVEAIQRFVKLLDDWDISEAHAQEIIVLGPDAAPCVIEMTHDFLEARMGIVIPPSTVINLLTRLDFQVLKSTNEEKKAVYLITVPPFRASKDIKIREDIVEEVVRSYGFDKIPLQMPTMVRTPFSLRPVMRQRAIKAFLASAARMTEQQNYALLDEQFCALLGLQLNSSVSLVNPVSENYRRMIVSLVPGLLKNVVDNHQHRDQLAFFELGRIWPSVDGENKGPAWFDTLAARPECARSACIEGSANTHHERAGQPQERRSVAGIFFVKRVAFNFYQGKAQLEALLASLGFDAAHCSWQQATTGLEPWYRPYQTAQLFYDKQLIGTAGLADPMLLHKLGVDVACDAFVFELDGEFLINQASPLPHYKPLSKFQETYIDVSLMAPRTVLTATLQEQLAAVDPLVQSVEVVDFFEKDDWIDKRSVTLRLWLSSYEKTLEKETIEAVWKKAVAAVEPLGASVRM